MLNTRFEVCSGSYYKLTQIEVEVLLSWMNQNTNHKSQQLCGSVVPQPLHPFFLFSTNHKNQLVLSVNDCFALEQKSLQ